MHNRDQRAAWAHQTKDLTPKVIRSIPGATDKSHYYSDQLPPLSPPKTKKITRVFVKEGDTFTVAKEVMTGTTALTDQDQSNKPQRVRVAVLNMASDVNPGGGWLRGALAQEEALCLRSTLASTLKNSYYEFHTLGAVWSPSVVVFRDELEKGCEMYEEKDCFIVGVVSIAGLRHPPLVDDESDYKKRRDAEIMRHKMRQMLRIMSVNGITVCVLGALGCGVFGNPSKRVAQLFRQVIMEEEFKGHFDEIVFAILDPKKEGNLRVFEETIGDFVISA